MRKLGQDSNYTAEANGRRYRVFERHYALTPGKERSAYNRTAGVSRRTIDPNDFNSLFNRGRTITAHSDAIELDVRPRPPASGSDAWLPAQSLSLTAEGIDATTSAQVGEPLTLTLKLKAQGSASNSCRS